MPMIVGHRGARNLWPENSLGGFRNAVALGVDAIEFDVHETRDRRFVVIHDPTLARTTFSTGTIRDMDAVDVVQARLRPVPDSAAGGDGHGGGECVPMLEAVLDLLSPAGLELHIEIKTDLYGQVDPEAIDRLLAIVDAYAPGERAILTCFVPEVLERIHATRPDVRILASLDHRAAEMLGGLESALARYAALPECVVAVQKDLLAAAWTRCLDVLGAGRLGVWVVNEPAEFDRWLQRPLRQITTDRPDLGLAARTRHQRTEPAT